MKAIIGFLAYLALATGVHAASLSTPIFGNHTPSVANNGALSALRVSDGPPAVMRLGYAAAGDAPMVMYAPSASPCALNAGAGDGGSQIPSADGKCWVWLPNDHGIQADIFGVHGDFTHDDGTALQAALNAASPGGAVLISPSHPYWTNRALTVPENVTLQCESTPQKQHQTAADYTRDGCAIYTAPGKPIIVFGILAKIRVYQDNIHFAGNPTTAHALAAIVNNYPSTGTGVVMAAYDAIVEDVSIAGYNLGIQQHTSSRGHIRNVLIEATNCIQYGTIGDLYKDDNIECWPFYSAGRGSTTFYFTKITNIVDNGSGKYRVTTTKPVEPFQTGDEIYLSKVVGALGANGRHKIAVVNPTQFDLVDSEVSPARPGDVSRGLTYISGLPSVANLWVGQGVSDGGVNIPAGATIAAIWQDSKAISLDKAHPATGTAKGETLTFSNAPFSGVHNPVALFYPPTFHGICLEFTTGANGLLGDKYYCHDYDIGIKFDAHVFSNKLSNVVLDSAASKWDLTRYGVYFAEGTHGNKIDLNYAASGGTFVVHDSTQPDGLQNQIAGGYTAGWEGSLAEIRSGSLAILGLISNDGQNAAEFSSDILVKSASRLLLSGGTRLPWSNVFVDAVSPANLAGTISQDTSSRVGGAGRATPFYSAMAQPLVVGGTAAPTCAVATGGGASPACAFGGGAGDSFGVIVMTPGPGAASSGTVTLAVPAAVSPGGALCIGGYDDSNGGTSWASAAPAPHVKVVTSTSVTFSWDNAGSSLLPGKTYRLIYHCIWK